MDKLKTILSSLEKDTCYNVLCTKDNTASTNSIVCMFRDIIKTEGTNIELEVKIIDKKFFPNPDSVIFLKDEKIKFYNMKEI